MAVLILLSIRSNSTAEVKSRKDNRENLSINPQTLTGNSEFRFKPVDDQRIWNVINRYSPIGKGTEYNMSSYTFTADSVTILNEIAGLPDENSMELYFNRYITENNISNNNQYKKGFTN